jgi:hypothetical protein
MKTTVNRIKANLKKRKLRKSNIKLGQIQDLKAKMDSFRGKLEDINTYKNEVWGFQQDFITAYDKAEGGYLNLASQLEALGDVDSLLIEISDVERTLTEMGVDDIPEFADMEAIAELYTETKQDIEDVGNLIGTINYGR